MLRLHALAFALHRRRVPIVPRVLSMLIRVVTGATIPAAVEMGRGCHVAYGGAGLVIHPRAVIGARVLLSPGVVIGGRSEIFEVPVIGDDVEIYPNAAILGPIHIGDGCVIGCNAIVVDDLPAGSVVVAAKGRVLTRPQEPRDA